MIKFSQYTLLDIQKRPLDWTQFEGKTLLFCNIARFCGFSSQLNEIDKISQSNQNLAVILSPCNQFMQEPGSDEKLCHHYQSDHLIFTEKVNVNGQNTHPIYRALKHQSNQTFLKNWVFWNFTKFTVSPDRNTVHRYDPWISPLLISEITDSS